MSNRTELARQLREAKETLVHTGLTYGVSDYQTELARQLVRICRTNLRLARR